MKPINIIQKLNEYQERSTDEDYIKRLNDLRKEYYSGHRDKEVEQEVIKVLNEIPVGTTLYQNYKDTSSGYTSWGSYHNEYAKINKYTKQDEGWHGPYGVKDVNDMKLTVLYGSSDMKTKEQAENDKQEMEKTLKNSHRMYTPAPANNNKDPHWDGNFYGI